MAAPGSRWPALRIFRLCYGVQRGLTIVYFACVVVAGLVPPGFMIATGALVTAVAARTGAWRAFALASALYLMQRLLAPIQQELGNILARRVHEALTERLMIAVSAPPGLAHVEDPATVDAIARAQGTLVEVSPGGAALRLGWVLNQRIESAIALLIVASWRVWPVVVLVPVYLATFAATRRHWHQATQVMYGRSDELRHSYYLRKLALTPELAKETRVFGLAPWLVERYRTGWLAAMRDVWHRRRAGWIAELAAFCAIAVAELAIIAVVATRAAAGELAVGRAVVVAGAVVSAGMAAFFQELHWFIRAGADSIAALEAMQRTEATAGGVVGGTASADQLPRRTICFEAVRFGYPGRDQPVFAALDLAIEAGRSLAIVGDNGAGKTTLVKLLARLYDPDAGRITVDGIDLRDLAPRAWHRRIAAIFQDFTQFELSAEDNVAFGALDHRADRVAVERAAEQAGAASIIARLARGWQTPLSRQFSDGTQLSGGEWQRLALARALFAVQAGAGVLVLDEPTAALDVRGEAEVYERFLELTRGVTTLVISHRFSTVRRADRIVVLEHGRVIEDGNHDQLVAAGGRYAAMYALQASRFADAPVADA